MKEHQDFPNLQMFRSRLEGLIEAAIDLLDVLDGEPDEESENGLDQDETPVSLNPTHQTIKAA